MAQHFETNEKKIYSLAQLYRLKITTLRNIYNTTSLQQLTESLPSAPQAQTYEPNRQNDGITPGKYLFLATAFMLCVVGVTMQNLFSSTSRFLMASESEVR